MGLRDVLLGSRRYATSPFVISLGCCEGGVLTKWSAITLSEIRLHDGLKCLAGARIDWALCDFVPAYLRSATYSNEQSVLLVSGMSLVFTCVLIIARFLCQACVFHTTENYQVCAICMRGICQRLGVDIVFLGVELSS